MRGSENGLVLILGCDQGECELTRLLEASGFKLRLVDSPEALLYVAKSISPDVILVNAIKSPFNFNFFSNLINDPYTALISTLVLSTATSRDDRLRAIQAGADDFITHPFDNDEVLIRLRNAITRTRQARELKQDAVRIQQLEEARAELTQLMVRDMKTPLAGLADLLEMAGGTAPRDFKMDASRFVNEALGATETLEELIEFLMSVRKMMAGEEIPQKKSCDILELSRCVSEALSESAQAVGVTLAVEGTAAPVLCDPSQMTRVIRHLMRLAIKSNPAAKSVKIRTEHLAGQLKLMVVCEGGTGDSVVERDGLGLTYCRLVATAHGGAFGVPLDSGDSAYWWVALPEAVGLNQATVPAEAPMPVTLERSRRYLGELTGKVIDPKKRSLLSLGTRQQFIVAVALMSVIPLLAFAYVLGNAVMTRSLDMETIYFLLPSIVTLMALGVMLLARHTIEVSRLRQYLDEISRGGAPLIAATHSSADFAAIQRSLGAVIKQGTEKMKVMEARSKALVQAEQQRVMAETVGAACHHLGQPATIIRGYLDLMKRVEVSPEMRAMIQECQTATEEVATVLSRLKGVGQYETEPYLTANDARAGRADERILKI
ncbi:MAG: HAMP domain-containing sensor histidine kinase [bacterium]